VFEDFRLQTGAGVGAIGIGGPPSRVGGQIALSGSHLVDSPGNEFAQAHQGPRGHSARVQVVSRRRAKGVPLLQQFLRYTFLQGRVGVVNQGQGGEGGGRVNEVGVDHGHPR